MSSLKNFLKPISAKDKDNKPCCTYTGPGGAGHFVKMIHNGIEYGEMQLISECYHLLRFYLHKEPEDIATIFSNWITNKKDSFLLEITIDILKKKEGNDHLIDKVLDKAAQKGTGGWSTTAALEVGTPFSTISESVMARYLSAKKEERIEASKKYKIINTDSIKEEETFIQNLEDAFFMSSIINHAIGFDVIQQVSRDNNWEINLSEVARIWTKGCIIRSDLMENIFILVFSRIEIRHYY